MLTRWPVWLSCLVVVLIVDQARPGKCSMNFANLAQPSSMNCSPALASGLLHLRVQRDNPTRQWWLATQHHRTAQNRPLDFTRHAYLVAIYQDVSPDIRVMKATQCGLSEYEWARAMAKCDQGQSIFWVFPTEQLRDQLVHARFDQIVANTPFYSRMAKRVGKEAKGGAGAERVSLKQFGSGTIALVPSNTVVAFRSFSADDAVIDELDECDQVNLPMVDDRLAASSYRTKLRVGNPRICGSGIEALYAASDRKRWFIRCDACGQRQVLDWFVNVVRETDEGQYALRAPAGERGPDAAAVCASCAAPLNCLGPGEWVAEYPGRSASGYHVSQLFSGTVTLNEQWDAFQRGLSNQTEMQRFYNSVLGIPYAGEGAKLSEALLARVISDYGQQSTGENCVMGVDVGAQLHVCIIDPADRVVKIATAREFSELDEFMVAYHATAVVDALPETREARHFSERHSGRVFLCQFVKSDKVPDVAIDPIAMTVKADRTQTLDESHAAILQKRISLPRDALSIPDFVAQMCAPTRVFNAEKQVFRWEEGSLADHYRHAFNYAMIARSIVRSYGLPMVWI